MKSLKTWVAAAGLVALTGAANAALVSLGDGTVKDTNTNLIWLQDWRSTADADLTTQIAWADGLDYAGSTDWRLPSLSEFRALLLAYGALERISEFSNVSSGDYWTTTPGPFAGFWQVIDGVGGSSIRKPDTPAIAVALRTGDAVTAVPEPQTLALVLLALGATVALRTRRSR